MTKKHFIIIVMVAVMAGALVFAGYKFLATTRTAGSQKSFSQPAVPKDVPAQLEKRGEEIYRSKTYSPLIAVYKGMLAKFPDNIEVKKKLAFAYFGARDYNNAKPLLDEVARTPSADAEVLRELEIITTEESVKK